jgi:hypothetical protein
MRVPRFRSIVILANFVMVLVVAGAGAAMASNPNAGCNQTPYENPSGNGANHSGAYDDTCDGSPSLNGNGDGAATGKPCGGCVGKADEKNPPGQAPDGTDANSGYECDSNSGVGKTNPAHSGCAAVETPENPPGNPPENPPGGNIGTDVLGEKFLATTGVPTSAFLATGMLLLAIGIALRFGARRTASI